MGNWELQGQVRTLHLKGAVSLPVSARWEEEYTVRVQLQERVNELQEVRAPHCLCFPLFPAVAPQPWLPVPPCLDLPPTLAVPLMPGFSACL